MLFRNKTKDGVVATIAALISILVCESGVLGMINNG
jgi:hypothetical protein